MKTKIDIISGFLGAGKTTLIKKLLNEKLKEEKVVIIENEFGETGIDGSIIKDINVEVKEINSGCICCSMSGEFINGIGDVISKFSPKRIIIEPTGVGKLSDVIKACKNEKISSLIDLNMVITAVDILKFNAYITNFGEFFENQIKYANVIILSRTDKANSDKLNSTYQSIKNINSQAVIITTGWDKISANQIISLAENKEKHSLEHQIKSIVKIKRPGSKNHSADEVFEVWEVETPKKYSKNELEKALEKLKDWNRFGMILRSKGILELDNGSWVNYDYVPEEININDYTPDYSGRICVIGSKLERDKLKELFGI